MSNYSQSTFFTPKDTLPTTDPAKTILGAQFDVEFANISTAITTKYQSGDFATFGNVNVNAAAIPNVGIYRPVANSLGFAYNGGVQGGAISATGNWTLNAPTAGSCLTINGFSGSSALVINVAAGTAIAQFAAGSAFPVSLTGASSSQFTFVGASASITFGFQPNGVTRLLISDTVVTAFEGTLNIAAAALMNVATTETGSFTATSVGITGTPGGTVNWSRSGPTVTLTFPSITGASSSTSLSFTGLPAALQPARSQRGCVMLEDATAFIVGSITVTNGSGTITAVRPDNAAFNAAGTKGIIASTITYPLN